MKICLQGHLLKNRLVFVSGKIRHQRIPEQAVEQKRLCSTRPPSVFLSKCQGKTSPQIHSITAKPNRNTCPPLAHRPVT